MTPVPPHAGLATRAKNATQRPGLVDVEPHQQKRRGPAEMAKVRSDAHLDTRLTDQRLHAALKKVAEIQDRQVEEDITTSVPKVAPSLRRQERKASSVPEDNDTPNEASPVENAAGSQRVYLMDEEMSEEEVAPVPLVRPPEPDYDDWFNFKSDPAYGLGETPKKKKKKGDGLRDVVATLRKNPPQAGANEKLKINLVTKIPPIPAPKGKKPRSLCVPIYIISTYITDHFSSPRLKNNGPLSLRNHPFFPPTQDCQWHLFR